MEHRAFKEAVIGVLEEIFYGDRRLVLEELNCYVSKASFHHNNRILGRGSAGTKRHSYNSSNG